MDLATFRLMFPAFSSVTAYSDEFITKWGDVASELIKNSWALNNKLYEQACFLMTAHLLHTSGSSASGSNGASGAVQSATQGSVSVSFVAPPVKNGWQFWLSGSPYGSQLWALLNAISAGGLFIGGLPERKAIRKVGGVWL